MPIGKFFAAWGADWTGRMSGLASILLTAWATFYPPTPEAARNLLLITAAVCFILGSYHIWAKEHKAYKDEQTKNELPEFKGELLTLEMHGISGPDPNAKKHPNVIRAGPQIGCDVFFKLYLVNARSTGTTVRRFGLTVKDGERIYTALCAESDPIFYYDTEKKQSWLLDNLEDLVSQAKEFRKGKGVEGHLKFKVMGLNLDELGGDPLFTVSIIDAFNGEHKVSEWGRLFRKPKGHIVDEDEI